MIFKKYGTFSIAKFTIYHVAYFNSFILKCTIKNNIFSIISKLKIMNITYMCLYHFYDCSQYFMIHPVAYMRIV